MARLIFAKNFCVFSSFSSSSSARPLLQICHFSTTSLNNPSYFRRHDDDSRNVPVSVWWDFENCNLSGDVNIFRIAPSITEALRTKGIKGPLQIRAFGDVTQLSRTKQEALSSNGIYLTHVPQDGKNSADRALLVDLMYWVSQNPPPAHLFLISSDRDFAGILHRLRMDNYNILIASAEKAPIVLCSAATIMWHWNSLLKGENLAGKHFNHPPDGPYGSWYGHHKVPLEDPLLDGKQVTCSQIEENSEPIADSKLRSIPVTKQVRKILKSHPKGISVSHLRAELIKSGIYLDKDYYGHKKFSRFLLSLGGVELHAGPDKLLFARYAPRKCPEYLDGSFAPSTESVDYEELNHMATSKLSGEGEKMVWDADVTPSMVSSHESSVKDIREKTQEIVDVANAQVAESQLPSNENEILSSSNVCQSVPKEYTTSQDYSAEQSHRILGRNGISNDISERLKAEDKYVKSTRKEADEVCHIPSPADESVTDKIMSESTETYSNNFTKPLTFLGWIKSWWPFRKEPELSYLKQTVNHIEEPELSEQKQTGSYSEEPRFPEPKQTVSHSAEPELSDLKERVNHSRVSKTDQKPTVSDSEEPNLVELKHTVSHSGEPELSELRQTVNHSREPELFSNSSFWSEMESFVFSSKGLILVSRSRSRMDLMHNFQKYGPLVLSSLSENDLLQLVDLLISKKKWLEESPSQIFPFRLTPSAGKSSAGLSQGANGLRSLFLRNPTQSNLQKSSERDVDKKYQSIPHAGVSSSGPKRKHTERCRTDMLADIQKLLNEILRAHSDGYDMSTIPKRFVERYGYPLDVQKLGYQKLASFLKTLPGVKIESAYIFPADHAICDSGLENSVLNAQETKISDAEYCSDDELSDSYPNDDCKDSPWEELGPVSVDQESKSRQEVVKLETAMHPDYEPSLSDDDSSESEDGSCLTQPEEGKPKLNVEDSSLLQTLDLFYSSQQGEDRMKSESGDTKGNGQTDGFNPSRKSNAGANSKSDSGEYREKQKPSKSYSFVSDHPVSNKKNELIDGILQSLTKSKSKDLKMKN